MDRKELYDFFRRLDRGLFLDGPARGLAALDQPLPIGYGQTISQPSLVAEMTLLLSPRRDSRVLEIGTGSGYQTAFLAEFSGEVFTVERIAALQQKAKQRLHALGYANVRCLEGDGSRGWPEHAPYDRIMVTAAAGGLPPELLEQLAPGGRMVIPLGGPGGQELTLVCRSRTGGLRREAVERVRFVELVGDYGWGAAPEEAGPPSV